MKEKKIGEIYKKKILNFQLDVIEIDENKNKRSSNKK